jgi:hypothetical protein
MLHGRDITHISLEIGRRKKEKMIKLKAKKMRNMSLTKNM